MSLLLHGPKGSALPFRKCIVVLLWTFIVTLVGIASVLVFWPAVREQMALRRFESAFTAEYDSIALLRRSGYQEAIFHSNEFNRELDLIVKAGGRMAAADWLVDVLADSNSDRDRRLLATFSLLSMGVTPKRAIPVLMQGLLDRSNPLAQVALSRISEDSIDDLVSGFEFRGATSRATVIEILGDLRQGITTAMPTLKRSMQDEHIGVRLATFEAAGKWGPHAAVLVPMLEERLTAERLGVRIFIACALTRITGNSRWVVEAMAEITTRATDDEIMVALDVIRDLGPLAEDAVPLIATFVSSDNAHIRSLVISTIKAIAPQTGAFLSVLEDLSDDSDQHVAEFARVMRSRLRDTRPERQSVPDGM